MFTLLSKESLDFIFIWISIKIQKFGFCQEDKSYGSVSTRDTTSDNHEATWA